MASLQIFQPKCVASVLSSAAAFASRAAADASAAGASAGSAASTAGASVLNLPPALRVARAPRAGASAACAAMQQGRRRCRREGTYCWAVSRRCVACGVCGGPPSREARAAASGVRLGESQARSLSQPRLCQVPVSLFV